ncbi:hypothetical protein BJV78DRAFT_1290334 [Lactifluus subvellereus]|nr:hypothetical protein BJV78DRAFT_1290334 [Lactifluus subvellereus]
MTTPCRHVTASTPLTVTIPPSSPPPPPSPLAGRCPLFTAPLACESIRTGASRMSRWHHHHHHHPVPPASPTITIHNAGRQRRLRPRSPASPSAWGIAHVEAASPPPSPPRSASVTHHHNPQPQVDNAVSTALRRLRVHPHGRMHRGPCHHHHHHPVPTVTHHHSCRDRQDAWGLKSLADKVAKGEAEHDEAERRLQEKRRP